MQFTVRSGDTPTRGILSMGEVRMPCALGRSGVSVDKREGDGATPVGVFPLRRVLYRPDRESAPVTDGLPVFPLVPADGWCDDPTQSHYNRPVQLPVTFSHEKLWRIDSLYDLLVILGHNDDPVVPGAGSAIFLHVARPDWAPTEGCVALAVDDLRHLLRSSGPGSTLSVLPVEEAASP